MSPRILLSWACYWLGNLVWRETAATYGAMVWAGTMPVRYRHRREEWEVEFGVSGPVSARRLASPPNPIQMELV